MAYEQQVECMHCHHSFRVCIPLDDMFPPKADSIFDADCPQCGQVTDFFARASTQRADCDGSHPVARTGHAQSYPVPPFDPDNPPDVRIPPPEKREP